MTTTTDIIDRLTDAAEGTKAQALRARRPVTKEHAQKSWLALFEPEDASQASLTERYAVATFVAALHDEAGIRDFYEHGLIRQEGGERIAGAVKALAASSLAAGPYGHYPAGPLSQEDLDGPTLSIAETQHKAFGPRLAAALEHAHLLVLHPRDAKPEALQTLLDAGWSTTGIVTLSQLVSFLAFQIRVAAGLKVLATA
jgi:CMD domain protein